MSMEPFEKALRALILLNLRDIDSAEQVRILGSAGYTPVEIGDLLGIKANTAAKALQRSKLVSKSSAPKR